jgi:hypothetical protein
MSVSHELVGCACHHSYFKRPRTWCKVLPLMKRVSAAISYKQHMLTCSAAAAAAGDGGGGAGEAATVRCAGP